jgi:hypothetical protein
MTASHRAPYPDYHPITIRLCTELDEANVSLDRAHRLLDERQHMQLPQLPCDPRVVMRLEGLRDVVDALLAEYLERSEPEVGTVIDIEPLAAKLNLPVEKARERVMLVLSDLICAEALTVTDRVEELASTGAGILSATRGGARRRTCGPSTHSSMP